MTRPGRVSPGRTFAALLTLVAAFLYPLRLSPGVPEAGGHPSMPQVQQVSCHGMDKDTETRRAPASTSGHAAHCLFCLTGVFAAAPDPGLGVLPAAQGLPVGRSPAPRPAHGQPLRVRARGPPPAALL